MIKPTVGRVVLFTPAAGDRDVIKNGPDRMAAIICCVWSDNCVNLVIFDANGNSHSRTSVPLIQDGEEAPTYGYFCEWMPYQKGQAAKTEALEKELKNAEGIEQSE